jgi:DNA-binding GntR family transcriptional regulator
MRVSLPHRTLSAAITDRLRTAILDGEHAAGAQLRQDVLAEAFGVSRIPVREALFQLEAEGLVQMVPHKGALVTGLSKEEVDDVFDLRVMLEPRLLRDAIPRLTDADFLRIEGAQHAFEAMITSGGIAGSGTLNAEFHMALYAAAHLPKSISIVAGLLQTSERYTRLQLSSSRAFAKAAREHRELLAACRAGDVRSACDLLAAHIEGVRADLAAVLRRTSGITGSVDSPAAIRMHEKPVSGSGRAPRARRS